MSIDATGGTDIATLLAGLDSNMGMSVAGGSSDDSFASMFESALAGGDGTSGSSASSSLSDQYQLMDMANPETQALDEFGFLDDGSDSSGDSLGGSDGFDFDGGTSSLQTDNDNLYDALTQGVDSMVSALEQKFGIDPTKVAQAQTIDPQTLGALMTNPSGQPQAASSTGDTTAAA